MSWRWPRCVLVLHRSLQAHLNPNPHKSHCFKYSPEKDIFNHLSLPALPEGTHHQLPVDKTNPRAVKPPNCCCPSGLSDPETPAGLQSEITETHNSLLRLPSLLEVPSPCSLSGCRMSQLFLEVLLPGLQLSVRSFSSSHDQALPSKACSVILSHLGPVSSMINPKVLNLTTPKDGAFLTHPGGPLTGLVGSGCG